jgi:Zn-dependent peptidase ImmA (M78 family)
VSFEEPLDPFTLARCFKIKVITPSQLRALEPFTKDGLTGRFSSCWSAVTLALADGWHLCVLNSTHNRERQRATLMEEIVHVVLNHEPSRILTGANGLACREYNPVNERVAYGVGAAVLVPYITLLRALKQGANPKRIAAQYGVSVPLVLYRIKITMLWPLYQSKAS